RRAATPSAPWCARSPASPCRSGHEAVLRVPPLGRRERGTAPRPAPPVPLPDARRADTMRLSRADRRLISDRWFTVDRMLLAAILVIIATGLLLSLAASPSIALKRGLPTFHFTERHLAFALLSAAVLFAVSLASLKTVRRLALAVLIASLLGMLLL